MQNVSHKPIPHPVVPIPATNIHLSYGFSGLLAQVQSSPASDSAGKERSSAATEEKDTGPRKRVNSDSRNTAPEYTKDQLEAVRKVKKCVNKTR